MKFTYRITEEDFVRASRLHRQKTCPLLKTLVQSLLIIATMVFVWVILAGMTTTPSYRGEGETYYAWGTFVPFLIVLNLWFIVAVILGRSRRIRAAYRKNPALHGEITVDIANDGINQQSPIGFSSQSNWTLFDFWSEAPGLILLILHSGMYLVLNTTEVPDTERQELRRMLSSALRMK